MDRPIIIIGAGGHAKVLLDTLLLNGEAVLGLTEFDAEKWNTSVLGVSVIGNDDVILSHSPDEIFLVNGMGSVGSTKKRQEIYRSFKAKGYKFATVVHPSAIISPYVVLGEGVQLMAGCTINAGTVIGDDSIVNTRASIDHDVLIGEHVHIAPGTTISGGVKIGDGVHIGTGASVIQGVQIGTNSIVGAGAVVLTNLPNECLAYGVPARCGKV